MGNLYDVIDNLRDESAALRAELSANAKMLAKQCDLAREAEAELAEAKANCNELKLEIEQVRRDLSIEKELCRSYYNQLRKANDEIDRLNERWWLTAIEKLGLETMHDMDTAKRQQAEYEAERFKLAYGVSKELHEACKNDLQEARNEIERIRGELETAMAEIHMRKTHLLCSFCSFEVQIDDEKKALDTIQKHVAEECEYHPITKLLQEARAQLREANEENQTLKILRDELFERLDKANERAERAGRKIWEAGTKCCMIGGDNDLRKATFQLIREAVAILTDSPDKEV